MDCTILAGTGSPLLSLLALAGGLLLIGALLTVAARARGGGRSVSLVVLVFAACALTAGVGAVSASASAESGCPDLSIAQTSSMTGLAPEVVPTAITGTVNNDGTAAAFVVDVTVTIAGVVTAPTAPTGPCGVGDYLLLDNRMPVGLVVRPGERVPFSGAAIGFNNTSANQDACKNARVDLRYVSS